MTQSVDRLSARYGSPRVVVCDLPSLDFPPVRDRVHGEVCMAIVRPNGRFLLQTKENYPGSVLRLPSGGIRRGEDVEKALLREIWEETNLTVTVERFVARIRYRAGARRSPFQTYLVLVRELTGELRSNDPSEKIARWEEAAADELREYAGVLRRIDPAWREWGEFRATALNVLADHVLGAGS